MKRSDNRRATGAEAVAKAGADLAARGLADLAARGLAGAAAPKLRSAQGSEGVANWRDLSGELPDSNKFIESRC